MKHSRKSARCFSSVVIIVLLIICCLFVISCGDSRPHLTSSELFATYDAIRTQTALPTSLPPSTSTPVITPTDPVPATPTLVPPTTGFPWDKAREHVGESVSVCGPVAGTRYATNSKGAPTFLNLGLTILIPGVSLS